MRIVFVHGAFNRDGAWWWAPTAAVLERAGLASTSVALPSCGEAGQAPSGSGPGLQDDAAAVRAALDGGGGGPAILIGHSYGAMVVSEVGDHPDVTALVYISAFLANVGESIAMQGDGGDPLAVIAHENGSLSVDTSDAEAFDARFLHDVGDPGLARGAHERLAAQSAASFGDPITTAAWQRVRSLYLVCAQDRSTSPERQRAQAARASESHEIDAAHFPMLSRPEPVAEHIAAFASG